MQELCEALLDLFGFGFGSDKPEEVIIGLCRLLGYAAWAGVGAGRQPVGRVGCGII